MAPDDDNKPTTLRDLLIKAALDTNLIRAHGCPDNCEGCEFEAGAIVDAVLAELFSWTGVKYGT